MFPLADPACAVALEDVGEDVLERLLALAVRYADADEVTPPLGSAAGWNCERITWFREYHRASTGVYGPARQKSWAISYAGGLAGSIRLKRTGPGTLETGIWLARSCRGLGIAQEALRQVMARAAASGAARLEATTTAGNGGALALLRGVGAELVFPAACQAPHTSVRARIPLR